jgi:uncharacterized membrane protein YedE/YeeE
MGKFIHSERIYNDRYWWFLIGFGSRYAGGCTSGHPFQVCLIYNGHHLLRLVVSSGGLIMANLFYLLFTLKNYSICKLKIKIQISKLVHWTPYVNESELEHKWHHNINT